MSDTRNAHHRAQGEAAQPLPVPTLEAILKATNKLKTLGYQERLKEELGLVDKLRLIDDQEQRRSAQRGNKVLPNDWVEKYSAYLKGKASIAPIIDYQTMISDIRTGITKEEDIYTVGFHLGAFLELLYCKNQKLLNRQDLDVFFKVDETPTPVESSYDQRFQAPESLAKPTINQIELNSKSMLSGHLSTGSISDASKRSFDADRSQGQVSTSSLVFRGHRGDEAPEEMYLEDEQVVINKLVLVRPVQFSHTSSTSARDSTSSDRQTGDSKERLLALISQFRTPSKTDKAVVSFDSVKLTELQKRIVTLFGTWGPSMSLVDPLTRLYGGISTQVRPNINALSNTGQYCYANSVVQLLFTVPELVNYFASAAFESPSNGNKVLAAFQQAVKEYFSHQMVILNVEGLIAAFQSKLPEDQRENQQDVDEFLRRLLDDIDKPLKNHIQSLKVHAEIKRDFAAATDSWVSHRVREPSVITYLFTGEIKRTVVCINCLASSKSSEPFECLPLDLDEDGVPLERLFQNSIQPELIDEGFCCDGCKKKTPAVIMKTYSRLPRYLLVQLKRFKQDGSISKDERVVRLRQDQLLDLSGCSTDPLGQKYRLQGIIHHLGSLNNGHYKTTAFRPRPEKPDQWVLFDDKHMYLTDPARFLEKQAYILLFKRETQ